MPAAHRELIAIVGNVFICDFRQAGAMRGDPAADGGKEAIADIRRTVDGLERACRELAAINTAIVRQAQHNASELAGAIGLLDEVAFCGHRLARDLDPGGARSDVAPAQYALRESARVTAEIHGGVHDLAFRIDAVTRLLAASNAHLRAIAEEVATRCASSPHADCTETGAPGIADPPTLTLVSRRNRGADGIPG